MEWIIGDSKMSKLLKWLKSNATKVEGVIKERKIIFNKINKSKPLTHKGKRGERIYEHS